VKDSDGTAEEEDTGEELDFDDRERDNPTRESTFPGTEINEEKNEAQADER
jgi:hypothetical protein